MAKMMTLGRRVLREYKVEDLIYEGGQASLAKGTDRRTKRSVAIKQLAASPSDAHYDQELARFKRTGQLRINHPAVVDPIDFGRDRGEWYLIMPMIEGLDLDKYVLQHGGSLIVDEAATLIRKTAEGLQAIHAQRIVYRDLKPANIRIDTHGDPHILDLGICRDLRTNTLTTGSGLLGSLPWMAPEQVIHPGSEDPRTDLYSLGAVFYFTLTGVVPVQGTDPQTVALCICREIPASPRSLNPQVSKQIDQACMKLLAKHPEDRFSSAEQFILALTGPAVPEASECCRRCGAQVAQGATYCGGCGAELGTADRCGPRCLACGAGVGDLGACPACRRPFSPTNHRVVFTGGPLSRTTFRIPEGNYEVGRHELEPRDGYLSKRHFRVACRNGTVEIQDVGSTNKTYVAGQFADQPLRLHAGHNIQIADNLGTFVSN